ncbi:MAG: hypothetical protein U9N57_01295 [Pseudomonadota bacterium]|nr:hypothetical protein [Pseudomonadota bacterium]
MELLDLNDHHADQSEEGRQALEEELFSIDLALNQPSNTYSPPSENDK